MKYGSGNQPTEIEGIEHAFKGLVAAQFSFGKELLKLASGVAGEALGALKFLKGAAHGDVSDPFCRPIAFNELSCSCASGCDIPEPCWMPLALGEVTCSLHCGGEAHIRLVITNEDFRPHAYTARSAGADAALVAFAPPTLKLGAKERGVVEATITLPAQATKDAFQGVIWIEGCRNHYLRWELDSCGKAHQCCREVPVDDQPDYIVHWYDHFYCPRPCPGPRTVAQVRDQVRLTAFAKLSKVRSS